MVLHKRRFPFRSWVLVNILAVIWATRDGDLCFQIVNFISCQEGTNTFLCSQRHASWMPYRVKVSINPGGRALIGKLAVAKLVEKCPACIEVKDVYNSLLLLLILRQESSIHFHILLIYIYFNWNLLYMTRFSKCTLRSPLQTKILYRWSRGSVLAFGTQVRGFKPGRSRRIFRGEKNPQHAFLRRGSKAVSPMS